MLVVIMGMLIFRLIIESFFIYNMNVLADIQVDFTYNVFEILSNNFSKQLMKSRIIFGNNKKCFL